VPPRSLRPSVPCAASRAAPAGQGRLPPCLRCSPGGSPPRASRGPRQLTPRLRSSGRLPPARPPAAPSLRAGGARKRACLWPFAQRRKRSGSGPQPPRHSGRRTRRARRAERLSRRVHTAASVSRRLPPSAWSLAGGQAPRDPPPPCGRRTARRGTARGHARYGHPGRAAHPGVSAPGVAPQPGHPTRAWLQPRPGALTPRHHERGVPPAWGAVVRPAAAPGLASRSLLAPAAAGRRGPPEAAWRPVRGPRLARRAGAARAGTVACARLAGRSFVLFWHPGRRLGPRAPGGRRPQPRSLRCAPPGGGRLRRGFDPATRQGQRLGVAAARSAPGAMVYALASEAGTGPKVASKGGAPPPLDPRPGWRADPSGREPPSGATPGLSPLGPGSGFARRGTATKRAMIFARVGRAPAQCVRDSPLFPARSDPGTARSGQSSPEPHAPERGPSERLVAGRGFARRRAGGPQKGVSFPSLARGQNPGATRDERSRTRPHAPEPDGVRR
jgi:hypothetical protein